MPANHCTWCSYDTGSCENEASRTVGSLVSRHRKAVSRVSNRPEAQVGEIPPSHLVRIHGRHNPSDAQTVNQGLSRCAHSTFGGCDRAVAVARPGRCHPRLPESASPGFAPRQARSAHSTLRCWLAASTTTRLGTPMNASSHAVVPPAEMAMSAQAMRSGMLSALRRMVKRDEWRVRGEMGKSPTAVCR